MLLDKDFTLDRYGLHVRLVNEDDAAFIISLRMDLKLGRFINPTSSDLDAQIQWTRDYKKREADDKDFYFIFETPMGKPIGVCRIYNVLENEFTSGSWVFSKNAPVGSAILADIISREIAFDLFPNSTWYCDVKKDNVAVHRYILTYKGEVVRETGDTLYYKFSKNNFDKYKQIHLRMFAPKNK